LGVWGYRSQPEETVAVGREQLTVDLLGRLRNTIRETP
jgi:hypothetical protein